jgi:hypothetical protein
MLKLLRISREALFPSPEGKRFPDRITVLADIKRCRADIDVIIGTHDQPEAVNLTIGNYLALEKKAAIHILVIESSRNPLTFWRIRGGPRVSKVLTLSNLRCTSRKHGGRFWASNGVALAAHLGSYLGSARYAFFSHTDMMGYKENFLSFLLSKLDDNIPLASFTQRKVLPFTGGMLYDKDWFRSMNADWLPREENPYSIPGLDRLRNRLDHLNWIDTGEQLVLEALKRGQGVYVCASRGATGDYYRHALASCGLTNQEVNRLGVPIRYAPQVLSREAFSVKYPEFASLDNAMWRKCFNDAGDVVFVHRGRGTTKAHKDDKRGDFVAFVREFNHNISRLLG